MQQSDPAPRPSLAVELAGWYGMAALLGAYALLTYDVIDKSLVYQLLNLTGAIGVGLVCWQRRTWPAFWLEAVWALVALVALGRLVVG